MPRVKQKETARSRRPQLDSIEVELGGEPRRLIYDLNAFVDIEERIGINILQDGFSAEQLSARMVRVFLWAGLRQADENLTEREVGSWLSLNNIDEVGDVIMDAIEAAMPPEEEDAGDAEGNPTRA